MIDFVVLDVNRKTYLNMGGRFFIRIKLVDEVLPVLVHLKYNLSVNMNLDIG